MNIRLVAPLVAGLAAVACGGAAPAPVAAPPQVRWNDAYAGKCQALAAEHTQRVADKKYVPVELLVHEWPADATPTADGAAKSFLQIGRAHV